MARNDEDGGGEVGVEPTLNEPAVEVNVTRICGKLGYSTYRTGKHIYICTYIYIYVFICIRFVVSPSASQKKKRRKASINVSNQMRRFSWRERVQGSKRDA